MSYTMRAMLLERPGTRLRLTHCAVPEPGAGQILIFGTGTGHSAEMDQFAVQYENPLFRLPMTFAEIFPVGVLVSLVSALVLRNPRVLPAR